MSNTRHPDNTRTVIIMALLQAYQRVIRDYRDCDALPSGLRIHFVAKQEDAPQSLTELVDCVDSGHMPIAVEFGQQSIYGGELTNGVFRAFHDCGHYVHGKAMAYEDEVELALLQWEELMPHLWELLPGHLHYRAKALYLADTLGQSVYCNSTGRFPADQHAFVGLVTAMEIGIPMHRMADRVKEAAETLAERCPAI